MLPEKENLFVIPKPRKNLTANEAARIMVFLMGLMLQDEEGNPVIIDDPDGVEAVKQFIEKVGFLMTVENGMKIPVDLRPHFIVHHRSRGSQGPLHELAPVLKKALAGRRDKK